MIQRCLILTASLLCVTGVALLAPSADQADAIPKYKLVADWPQLPAGAKLGGVTAVATDAADRVYLFHRGKTPVMVFDKDGKYLKGWGDGLVKTAHGLRIDQGQLFDGEPGLGIEDGEVRDEHAHVRRRIKRHGCRLGWCLTFGRFSDTGRGIAGRGIGWRFGCGGVGRAGCGRLRLLRAGRRDDGEHQRQGDGQNPSSPARAPAFRGEGHGERGRERGLLLTTHRLATRRAQGILGPPGRPR